MSQSNELDTRQIISSTIIAAALAALVLVLFILPAEYNIDPTGLGTKMGLTELANPSPPPMTDTPASVNTGSNKFVSYTIKVPARGGIEKKFIMQAGEAVTYRWLAASPVYVDLHGEPEGDTTGYFQSYIVTTSNDIKGSFSAPFTGTHGWYWRNDSDQDVSIQLVIKGQYREMNSNQPSS